ncbi:BQ5605_C007g04853 [Microbotryum silenes-dioicae]|uniref:BQ5605_C007g04853 protein n=1 Tax=Microbotryum silenes-dioicae TaxID=796604 RepID=A0A2X0PA83_9BASI|nr:BQ5605_C007g04853 [Microbotryum silenes-dioicae]
MLRTGNRVVTEFNCIGQSLRRGQRLRWRAPLPTTAGPRPTRPQPSYEKMASTPSFLFAGSTKRGHPSPEKRDDEAEDNEEEDEDNFEHLGRSASKGAEVESLALTIFAYYLHERDEYFSIPYCTQSPFLEFVIDGYSHCVRDRSTPTTFQESLRITTGQAITDRCYQTLDPGSNRTFGDSGLDVQRIGRREITQRYLPGCDVW